MDETFENGTTTEENNSDATNIFVDESNAPAMAMSLEKEEEPELNQETDYAIAWSVNQGSYSEGIAKKTLNFEKLQGLKIRSVLDICCGSANFLKAMHDAGKKCAGTEILDSYIEYNKAKYKDIDFYKTSDILDFDNLGTFDLVSCNHDVVNYLPTIESWGRLFRMAYRHLNNGGVFIFDYYTKRKLSDWNEVVYDESDKLDYIKNVVSNPEQANTKIQNIFYINLNPEQTENSVSAMDREYSLSNHDIKYKRTEDINTEYYFDNEAVLSEIKKAGYRYLITTDANFTPIKSIEDQNRMHIIAIKREK